MLEAWRKGFAATIDQQVDWADMDSFGHVNNAVYFRYFENGRVDFLARIGWWDWHRQTGNGPILASVQARFRRPVTFPDRLIVGSRPVDLRDDRFTLEHQIFSAAQNDWVTEGQGVIVSFDYRQNAKAALPEEIRRRLAESIG